MAAQFPQQDPTAAMSASNGSAEIDQRLVWYACVFGAYLSGEITHRAQIGTCHYCGCERTGVTRSFLRVRQMKMLAAEEDTTTQALLEEAIDGR